MPPMSYSTSFTSTEESTTFSRYGCCRTVPSVSMEYSVMTRVVLVPSRWSDT